MFSVFPESINRANIQQENNIQAKKPGISNRKPLADRKLVENGAVKPLLQEKLLQKKIEVKTELPFIDICSYKEVSDTYNDVMGPNKYNLVSSILSGKYEKTPPPKRHHFDYNLIENEPIFKFDSFENENFEILDIDEAPLPELNFVF